MRWSKTAALPDEVNTLAAETPVEKLPDECLGFLLGSRYCETDHMGGIAWSLFGDLPPGWARVQAICDFVHNRLSFSYGYARSTRTAAQAYEERVGVCRDFAHLAITLCRCMNIPARYVNGYLGDIGVPADPAPMDFSAWFEVWLDGKWYTFDARHNMRAHRPRRGGARPRRDRRAAAAQLWAAHADAVQDLDLRAAGRARADAGASRRPHRHGADAGIAPTEPLRHKRTSRFGTAIGPACASHIRAG